MSISENGYYFIPYLAVFGVIVYFTIQAERKDKTGRTLRLEPWLVVRQIIINQVVFYFVYFITMFTLNLLAMEKFYFTQIFSSRESGFSTRRGCIGMLGLFFALVTSSFPMQVIVKSSREMLDFAFTTATLHFLVVSIVMGEFPATGAWWLAYLLGLVATATFSEWLGYKFEVMPYKASMGGNIPKKPKPVATAEDSPMKTNIDMGAAASPRVPKPDDKEMTSVTPAGDLASSDSDIVVLDNTVPPQSPVDVKGKGRIEPPITSQPIPEQPDAVKKGNKLVRKQPVDVGDPSVATQNSWAPQPVDEPEKSDDPDAGGIVSPDDIGVETVVPLVSSEGPPALTRLERPASSGSDEPDLDVSAPLAPRSSHGIVRPTESQTTIGSSGPIDEAQTGMQESLVRQHQRTLSHESSDIL